MIDFIIGFFTSFLIHGIVFGFVGWCFWSWYWNVHVEKPTSLKFFRWLRGYITLRTSAMIILSLSVTIGFLGFFSRVLDLVSALTATLTVAILEAIVISSTITKNKVSGKEMKKVRGPRVISFLFLLTVGMAASAFFFSFTSYIATMLAFLIIMLPTVGFILIAYKLFTITNKKKKEKPIKEKKKTSEEVLDEYYRLPLRKMSENPGRKNKLC